MTTVLDFIDGSRTYSCSVGSVGGARAECGVAWWWFTVSGDGHRYAPFHVAADDTPESVRERIVAYYVDHVARRAMPTPWYRRGRRPPPAAASTATVSPLSD